MLSRFHFRRLSFLVSLIWIVSVSGYRISNKYHPQNRISNKYHSRYIPHRYAYAKTVDYDKLLKWQEMEDIENIIEENEFEVEEEEDVSRTAIANAANNLGVVALTGHHTATAVTLFRKDGGVSATTGVLQVHWARLPNTKGGGTSHDPPAAAEASGANHVYYEGWTSFKWEEYLDRYNEGIYLTNGYYPELYKRVLKFRNEVMVKLLGDTGGYLGNTQCFDNMGSVKPKSDLDFTFVRWDEPQNVVGWLTHFYKECFAATGVYPAKFGDMNFYIASPYASKKPRTDKATDFMAIGTDRDCLGTVPADIKRFFSRVDVGNPGYELWAFAQEYHNAENYKKDLFMAFYLLDLRFKSSKPLDAPFALQYLIKFSVVFYNEMVRALPTNADVPANDMNKLYTHSLLYWMNYHSDESYITNIALIDIWFAMKSELGALNAGLPDPLPGWATVPTPSQVFILMLDQFAFVKSYYEKAKGKKTLSDLKKVVHFIDRTCKYMDRIYDFANTFIGGWAGTGPKQGISEAIRKKFNDFRAVTHPYSEHRGKVAESDVLRSIRNRNAAGTREQKCAMVIYQATKGSLKTGTDDMTLKALWDTHIDDLIKQLKAHFDDNSFLPAKMRKNIGEGMKVIYNKIDSLIKLKDDHITFMDGETKKDGTDWANTVEGNRLKTKAKKSASEALKKTWENDLGTNIWLKMQGTKSWNS